VVVVLRVVVVAGAVMAGAEAVLGAGRPLP
jgi:hypothetical protein